MNIVARARHRAAGIYLLLAILVVAGIYTAARLPSSIFPSVTFPIVKVIADVGTPRAAIAQLVATGPERIHHRDIWEATGTLSFGEGATDELHCLAPREIVAAQYWANVDLTIGWGTVLEELGDGVWDG